MTHCFLSLAATINASITQLKSAEIELRAIVQNKLSTAVTDRDTANIERYKHNLAKHGLIKQL